MPPIVEAKMMARMRQQIMIMIFFCSSRQEVEKDGRNISIETGRSPGRDPDGAEERPRGKECLKAREDGSVWSPESHFTVSSQR